MRIELIRARVNAKSLAAEAAIIKKEISRAKSPEKKNDLYIHRMIYVRPEARLTNLAIGFIKGRKRSEVEKSSKPIDIRRLTSKINKFLLKYPEIKIEEVCGWFKEL